MSSYSSLASGMLKRLQIRLNLDFWTLGSLLIAAIVLLPVFAVIVLAMFPTENIWPHLLDTVLPGYIRTTLWLMLGVCVGTFIIGTGTAWLVSMCRLDRKSVV